MIPLDNTHVRQQVQDSLLNNDGMEALRAKGRNGDPEALREVARQFESMFVHQMFKQMRATNEVFGKDSLFSSEESKFHKEMLDQQMSLELTKGRGLGLAEMLYQQMERAYGDKLKPQKAESMDTSRLERQSNLSVPTAPVTGGKAPLANSPAEFVERIRPHAVKAAGQLGVAPQALIAQAALETGWGQHVIHTGSGANSHNLFNIKADGRWEGDRINVSTIEYRHGLPQVERADFRRYDNYEQSFADYVQFLQDNSRYQEALKAGDDAERYVEGLQDAGYATDPAYAEKLKTLMRTEPLMTVVRNDAPNPNDA